MTAGKQSAKQRVIPDAFVIDRPSVGILQSGPKALIRSGQAFPVKKHGQKLLDQRDNQFLKKGVYHLFRFPNAGSMKVKWFGHAAEKGEVEIYYWNVRKFSPAVVRKTRRHRGYVFDVNLPARMKNIYVLVNSTRGKIYTDYISATKH